MEKPLLKLLHKHCIQQSANPCFQVRTSQLHFLNSPFDYYSALNKGIEKASQRIILSALYMGTGDMEKFLLHQISQRIHSIPYINCTMLFDYNRTMRNNLEGLIMLNEFRKKHSLQNLEINLFTHPSSPILKKIIQYPPVLEAMGVHHIKAAVFDDDVILTG